MAGTTAFTYTLQSASSLTRTAIRGIIFDLDGTLTVPVLNFSVLRQELGIDDPSQDILGFVNSKSHEEKDKTLNIVEKFEEEGRQNLQFQPGLFDMLNCIADAGINKGLVTRNSPRAVQHFITKLQNVSKDKNVFSEILTRDFVPYKPSPEPLLHICRCWDINAAEAVMVGDAKDDILAGKSAGTVTVLLNNDHNGQLKSLADINVDSLSDFVSVLQNGFVLEK